MNLLYVAFTRACNSLYVIGKRGAKSSRSAIIEQTLPLVAKDLPEATLEGLEDDQATIHFTFGENFYKAKAPDLFHQPSVNPFLLPSETVNIAVETFESKVEFRQSNRSKAFTEGDDEETVQRRNYIQTGSILHEVFSTIRTADDIPDALSRLQFEGVIYDEQITPERIKALLQKRLSDPRVADWFSPRWTLFNECTILSVEDGKVVERRPDRVMTNGEEWIVVDFKFGSPKPEYLDQVREYMDLLASMGHHNIKGYLWYVYTNKIEEV